MTSVVERNTNSANANETKPKKLPRLRYEKLLVRMSKRSAKTSKSLAMNAVFAIVSVIVSDNVIAIMTRTRISIRKRKKKSWTKAKTDTR